MENFPEWLLQELNSRNMSQSDLARASGVTTAQISRIISGQRKPGPEVLNSISRALKLSRETVFRAAGLLPAVDELDAMIEEIIETTRHMSREEQREVLTYIRYRKSLEKKQTEQQTTPRGNLANNPAK